MEKTITLKEQHRLDAILPDGVPRYIHCYDNGGIDVEGGSLDRYTVVFTGRYTHKTGGEHIYLAMNSAPYQGIGQHGGSREQIDYPSYKHLGKRIKFADLPEDCRTLVMTDYIDLWDLLPHVAAQGKEAALASLANGTKVVNPYEPNTAERHAWACGWRNA